MNLIEPFTARAVAEKFPHDTFAIKHALADNPLFKLERIIELVHKLPRDRIEHNSGKAAISQDPDKTPMIDLAPEEIVRRIESCGAWMVLKRVEQDPDYRALLEDVLKELARARGFTSATAADFRGLQGFIFVSSPYSTTPFHADSDENIFFQIHGEKIFHVYDNRDRTIASDDQLEGVVTRHRNLHHRAAFDIKATHYQLYPGDGIFVPYQWPHFVQTADSYSISLSVTWKSAPVRWRNDVFTFNSMMRGIGWPQPAPGRYPIADAMKVGALRSARALVQPLRQSEALRRALRRIVLGKGANYYYREGKQTAA